MHVLIVDHDAETQTGLSLSVNNLGHNCQAVGSSEAVQSHLKTNFPDLVLMDLLLPDADARQLIQLIKRDAPQARIVAMVRPGSDASIREALSWGASDFLEKPVHELRLACLLSHLQSQLSHQESKAQNNSCLPDVFFNNDNSAYQLAKSRFQKALDMHIPLLIEGEPGTGKTTLARHFSSINAPTQTMLQLDVATDDFELFRQSPAVHSEAGSSKKYIILLKHIEAASLTMQRNMAEYISSCPHTIIATTRGRLLDHAKSGSIDSTLYNVLSPLPVWLAPLRERPKAYDVLKGQYLAQANTCFSSGIQQLQRTSIHDPMSGFTDNFIGLKRAIFKAVANHSSPISPAIIQPLQSSNTINVEIADRPVKAQQSYAMAPLLDQNGQIRTLKALEQDALLFAYEHHNARVGQIAKALKLGRTTLYRKLLELGLFSGNSAKLPEQNEIAIPTNHRPVVENREKYAA